MDSRPDPRPDLRPDLRRVAVTGAAGKTGRAVVAHLAAAGLDVTALVRRPEQHEAAINGGAARALTVDVEDPAALRAALAGQDAVYHVPPNMHPDEVGIAAAVVGAAEQVGLGRFVLHSVLAPYLPAMPHHLRKAESESLLRASGLDWTILQPASYSQNLLAYVPQARAAGRLTVPYSPAAPFTPVDVEDVAAVAAVVLTGSGHSWASYELCGPERLTTHAMAEQLGDVLGVDVTAAQQPLADWKASADLPDQVRDDLAAMFGYYDVHGLVGSGWTAGRLLGRPPASFAAVVARELAAGASTGP